MKSSNLVPKVIKDKNGVTTTRLVKPDKPSSSSMETFPHVSAVPTVSSADRKKMIKNLSYQFENWCDPQEVNVDGALAAIPKFESATLAALTADLGDHPEDKLNTAAIWIDLYSNQEPYLREIFAYRDAFDPSTDYSFVEESIYYLKECGDLPPMDDYSKATGRLQQTIRNLLSATETMIAEDYENGREGNDPLLPADMRKLIIDRPDDFERISDILVENPDIYSADRIVLMLENEAPSLSKGVL
jgi:hypothetical protein